MSTQFKSIGFSTVLKPKGTDYVTHRTRITTEKDAEIVRNEWSKKNAYNVFDIVIEELFIKEDSKDNLSDSIKKES